MATKYVYSAPTLVRRERLATIVAIPASGVL